jgi:hypothetical protein
VPLDDAVLAVAVADGHDDLDRLLEQVELPGDDAPDGRPVEAVGPRRRGQLLREPGLPAVPGPGALQPEGEDRGQADDAEQDLAGAVGDQLRHHAGRGQGGGDDRPCGAERARGLRLVSGAVPCLADASGRLIFHADHVLTPFQTTPCYDGWRASLLCPSVTQCTSESDREPLRHRTVVRPHR